MGREVRLVETEFGPFARRVMLDAKIDAVKRSRAAYAEAGVDVDRWLERLEAQRARLYEATPRVGL